MDFKENTKSVVTPGEKLREINEEVLDNMRATMYRACAARCNYMTQDRSDVQYAIKELCRSMSSPKEQDWLVLIRVARELSSCLLTNFSKKSLLNDHRLVIDIQSVYF